jgi:hypothetical protein
MFKFEFGEATSKDCEPPADSKPEPHSKRAKELLAARHHESKLNAAAVDEDFVEIQQVNDVTVKYLSDTKAEFATLEVAPIQRPSAEPHTG